METTVAGGLLVIAVIAIMLHSFHQDDQRKIAEVERRIKVLMDATQQGASSSAPCGKHADMANPSRLHENGPENAISEGVQRGDRR